MIEIVEVTYGSSQYLDAVKFRSAMLREPLGLRFSREDLDAEAEEIHFVGLNEDSQIVGSVILKPREGGAFELRQMAVDSRRRGLGLGMRLANCVEQRARALNGTKMWVKAREGVVPFYERCGYRVCERFERVGLPHLPMQKDLSGAT